VQLVLISLAERNLFRISKDPGEIRSGIENYFEFIVETSKSSYGFEEIEIRSILENDLRRIEPFLSEVNKVGYVTYHSIHQLSGKSRSTIQRGIKEGEISKKSAVKRPARICPYSTLAWHFGERTLPPAAKEREKEILWRLVFTGTEEYPESLPRYHDPQKSEETKILEGLLPPIIDPIPANLEGVLNNFSADDLRLLSGMFLNVLKKSYPKTNNNLKFKFFVWAFHVAKATSQVELDCPDEIQSFLDCVSRNPLSCGMCSAPGKYSGKLIWMNNDPEEEMKNKKEDEKDWKDEMNVQKSKLYRVYELVCSQCENTFTVSDAEIAQWGVESHKNFERLNDSLPEEQRLSKVEFNAYHGMIIEERRARKRQYVDIAKTLNTRTSSIWHSLHRFFGKYGEATGNNIVELLYLCHRDIIILTAHANYLWLALPSLFESVINRRVESEYRKIRERYGLRDQ